MGKLPTGQVLSSALEVVTVGTGTCAPSLDRRGPCTLLRCEGTTVVADLGLGAIHGLLHEGLRHNDVDALLFTHLHPDHTAELSSFLFAANYDHHPRTGPLRVVGGPGFLAFFRALESAHGDWLEPRGYRREVEELSCGQSFGLGPLSVRSGPVRHLPSSLAFRFESGRASVVLSGDTGPSPEIEAFAAGADLLVLEAGNAGREPGTGSDQHLTPRQAGEVARRAGARALVLHHLPVGGAAAAEAEREATEAFGAPAVAARDGRRFEVTAVRS